MYHIITLVTIIIVNQTNGISFNNPLEKHDN